MTTAAQPTNWAGNVTFGARSNHRPATVAELQREVARSDRIRALGTAHSFSRVADTTADLIDVTGLPHHIDIDSNRSCVRVAAGMRYGDLVGPLQAAGFALHNLGSLPHISVAGACATATHGSGDTNGNLATAVRGLELVTAAGDVVEIDRNDPDFPGTVVALGSLGVVTAVTLDLLPAFEIRQYVYDNLPHEALFGHLDEVFGGGYSVCLFTDWSGPVINQVWRKRLATDPEPAGQWLGATPADGPRHPVPGMPVANCTEQLGVPGPWHARLPHFRLEFTPSAGDELQSEYFVARADAIDALRSLHEIHDRIAPVVHTSELRTIAADDLWLSPHYGRDSVAIHFTFVDDEAAVTPVRAAVEERLADFAPRPHWAKMFGIQPEFLSGRYERLDDFRRLAAKYDPAGKFRNELVDRYVFDG
jgi:xylitol oxidase